MDADVLNQEKVRLVKRILDIDDLPLLQKVEHRLNSLLPNDKHNSEEMAAEDETAYISSSPQMMEIIKKGRKEIEEGKGTHVDIDDLWK